MTKKTIGNTASLILAVSLLTALVIPLLPEPTFAITPTMTFTTGQTINFSSNTDMTFWSGINMTFGTGIMIYFLEIANGNGILEPCDIITIVPPTQFEPYPCSWWEVLDPNGNPIGEFHIGEQMGPLEFHIDMVFPGPFPIDPTGFPNPAEKKIEIIEPCDYFVVHWPEEWYPLPCSWWEIIDPETDEPTGVEFHIDWTNYSCEFHIDEMINGPYYPPFPWWEIEARLKIEQIIPCDRFYVLTPGGYTPEPCTWWEIMYNGQPTGMEFHVDEAGGGVFHVDEVLPPPPIQLPPTYEVYARKKIDVLQPCEWFRVDDPTTTPKPCTWWKVVDPDIGDVEFHVESSDPIHGIFHVDDVRPVTIIAPTYRLIAEKKIVGIGPCDWFKVIDPQGWIPAPCSWWIIRSPSEWSGIIFHVDSTDGIDRFHIDQADPLPPGPTPPPWSVTADPFDPWYWKPEFPDYVPSGMPDFDQRQWGTYNWTDIWLQWSHCGPVACANSLWWLDSEFEPNPMPPPVISDGYPLVQSYAPGVWDDHDPRNVQPLVEHLAYLMDTDGRRTLVPGRSGTDVHDMEAGLAHYLSWAGVNPAGDVNGDGTVDATDGNLITAAFGSVPGMPTWNLAADIFPASVTYPPIADNVIDMNDQLLWLANVGLTGLFYEHTVAAPDFYYIEEEVERCQDVVLLIGYWILDGDIWFREPGGHYVTVAGVDSGDLKLALSDPVVDAFENGLIPEGRIPVPHVHMPPEPPYTTHNDAALVSQDIYDAMMISPPFPPCPGGSWMLVNFASWRPAPPFFAVIEAAVVTSPLGVHDVAVTDVKSSKDGCLPVPNVGQNKTVRVYVTVENQGDFAESFFNVTLYATDLLGSYEIGYQTLSLLPAETTVLTFVWDTTGYARGNYTLSAVADTVPGEIEIIDNSYVDGTLWVNLIGDINGDDYVGIDDLFTIASHFAQDPSHPDWNPNCDLNDDDYIGIDDIFEAASHFGEEGP